MFRDICFALPPPQPPPRAYKAPKLAQVKLACGEKVVRKIGKIAAGSLNSGEKCSDIFCPTSAPATGLQSPEIGPTETRIRQKVVRKIVKIFFRCLNSGEKCSWYFFDL